jgi:hypothetical protein
MGDVEAALAFVARRSGRRRLPASAWAFTLSLELGWMDPAAARAFVARAQDSGLLAEEEGELAIRIDPEAVEVPRGFRPDPAARPAPAEAEGFLAWVDRVAQATAGSREAVLQRVAARQQEMAGMLTADAAILWLAREAGLDVQAAARRLIPG